MDILIIAPIVGVLALIFAFYKASVVGKADPGTERMQEISSYIHEGAMAFLAREYKSVSIFAIIMFFILGFAISWPTAAAFAAGAACSALAGYFGMTVATKANVRTTNAAMTSGMNHALEIAFSGGSVMGMTVVGLGVLGTAIFWLIFKDANIVTGFSLGASSIALFARVGGGIYTKAADVGADLVGKVEAGIPEDDPRNPAVIADNVGDNVGDVAGMGADLFESYVGAIVSAITLGVFAYQGENGVSFAFMVSSVGIVASILGTLFVRGKEGSNPQKALNMGTYASSLIVMIASFFLSKSILGSYQPFGSIVFGVFVGLIIAKITEIYTSDEYKYVKEIASQSETGAATTIISGLSVGMRSTAFPIIVLAIGIIGSYTISAYSPNGIDAVKGLYGIALAAVGMLSTTGMTIAVDAYGPISDNAGGIAEMCELPHEVREITDKLDSVGNTTAAIGKGFAIGSAALTALALFASYTQAVGLTSISLTEPKVIAGLFIGGMLPFLFSAITMSAVGKAAFSMIEEVRRQFREMPGIMEGKTKPDYKRCVDISTAAALKEMVVPGLLAVIVPLIVGFLLGKEALGGLQAGALVTGVLMAIFMSNAGGAWDNAKKYIEGGKHGGKGSPAHQAAVVGDTVGDPFKDTSGPSINILIKLITVVSLIFGPLLSNGIL
ncbi:MAG: sodium-translocating pyrophosphatase [Tissierellia bacterium]|jgi:K(+)-stimulated pyrophosphate-energized sodium pump|nr:sodium-translocating pyrophosphatase [Tissierellia bacterium]MDD3226259.1 sodium-translocating pyrophosphatase [Tissierellia bacterium]MDD3751127.1 sodium-translocating pyrophosphatase [Tissierellia bacterium]MDD4046403.1 sodium-translocating pyrophosphatase [Tissierellia bacterium]MDD4678310.1 sodium-translocating pyrophosphatase [Tissierellia bacterium]